MDQEPVMKAIRLFSIHDPQLVDIPKPQKQDNQILLRTAFV